MASEPTCRRATEQPRGNNLERTPLAGLRLRIRPLFTQILEWAHENQAKAGRPIPNMDHPTGVRPRLREALAIFRGYQLLVVREALGLAL